MMDAFKTYNQENSFAHIHNFVWNFKDFIISFNLF